MLFDSSRSKWGEHRQATATSQAAVAAKSTEGALRAREQCLAEYKDLTMSALLAALPNTEPGRYLYDLVPLYSKRAGKGLRCGLIMATCGALWADPAR